METGAQKGAALMTSRAAILKRIVDAQRDAATASTVNSLQPEPKKTTHPTRGPDLLNLFMQTIENNGATVRRCGKTAEIPSILADLADIKAPIPSQVCVAQHAVFRDLDWHAAGISTVHVGDWTPDDTVALSHARLGIADSGSVVVASSADSPTGLAFLPEIHIVALQQNTLVANLTDAMILFGEWQTGERNALPRAINIISGASRTADIAGKIVHGAHGPRKLCVIIYDNV